MKDLLLGIDQGTSGCKMTVFDTDGQVMASVTKGYETKYPKPNHVEQDCEDWWLAVQDGIIELLNSNTFEGSNIVGIGVDGISWTPIPIDHNGKVLGPAMIWLDRRAAEEAQYMKEICGEDRLLKISGNPIDPAYMAPKILWYKKHQPELYANTDKFLQSNGFLVFKLTGEISQDISQGYGYHFFDISSGTWQQEILEELDIAADKLPPIVSCHDIVGYVTEEVSRLTGLKVGIPVVAGGLDAACCTLGAGVIDVGQTQEQGGQAGGMSIVSEVPCVHPDLILGYHVIPNKWLLQGGTTGGGGALRWFHREFSTDSMITFETLSCAASETEIGSNQIIFLPYMKGERSPIWKTEAKGVFYGLSFEASKKQMLRSIMEGVAYSLKHNLDTAMEVDTIVNGLVSVGGSSNSEVWTQMKSDVTNQIIKVPYSDHATALGAAILAGVGCGVYASFEEAIAKTVTIKKIYRPDEKNHMKYNEFYKTYIKLSQLLNDNMW